MKDAYWIEMKNTDGKLLEKHGAFKTKEGAQMFLFGYTLSNRKFQDFIVKKEVEDDVSFVEDTVVTK